MPDDQEMILIPKWEYEKFKKNKAELLECLSNCINNLLRAGKDYQGLASQIHQKELTDIFEKTFTELAGTSKYLEMEAEKAKQLLNKYSEGGDESST